MFINNIYYTFLFLFTKFSSYVHWGYKLSSVALLQCYIQCEHMYTHTNHDSFNWFILYFMTGTKGGEITKAMKLNSIRVNTTLSTM